MPWDINKPAGADAANTIDDSVIANNTALDTWASAITDGIAQAGATIFKMYRAANATIAKFRADAADTFDRFTTDLNGKLGWGPGTGAQDVFLERSAAGIVKFTTGALYAAPVFIDAQTATIDVVSTVTETNLYSVSLTQNLLAAGRNLTLVLWGDILKNAIGTVIIRAKLGATTIYQTNAITVATNASRQMFGLYLDLFAISTASQQIFTRAYVPTNTQLIGADADHEATDAKEHAGQFTAMEDNGAGAKTLAVTAQWSVSSASLSCRALGVKTVVHG